MRPHTLVQKLISPAGLVLVLLCFLLPFVTVSCESAVVDYEATYDGTDFVVGGDPHITVSRPGGAEGEEEGQEGARAAPQVLAILALFTTLTGIVVALLPYARLASRPTRARTIATAATAALALAFLVISQLVVTDHIVDELQQGDTAGIGVTRSTAEDMVASRFGFWLASTLLIAVIAYNVVDLGWEKLTTRTAGRQQQPPPPGAGRPPPPP